MINFPNFFIYIKIQFEDLDHSPVNYVPSHQYTVVYQLSTKTVLSYL